MELTKIHSDARGDINSLTYEGLVYPEVTVFRTNAGFARGGCIHEHSDEYCCVIQGSIIYMIGDSKKGVLLLSGESVLIPKNTPHYFISLTPSVVLEWGATIEEKQKKHSEYRAIVDTINKQA